MDLHAIRWCNNRQFHAGTAKHCTLRYPRIDENEFHILKTQEFRVSWTVHGPTNWTRRYTRSHQPPFHSWKAINCPDLFKAGRSMCLALISIWNRRFVTILRESNSLAEAILGTISLKHSYGILVFALFFLDN